MERFVCIHGHFYQPPRENPWLERVEIEDSAAPFHDWNARITAECYGPDAHSRLLDGEGFVRRMLNNYARISFNFGPSLLSWLEGERPEVYADILAADRDAQRRFEGHGSAVAQSYSHVILPLANKRDQRTQVIWGKRDFQRRFGRAPEGMWLPETAADTASLEALAEQGIRFTVLAPHQARRVRPIAGGDWLNVDGKVDTSRAYRVRLPSGRSISVFFYDGALARSIAFDRVLTSGEEFVSRLSEAATSPEPRLVNVATDGETYGHHKRFGDMALAYALESIETGHNLRLTNYGQFLALHPPAWEAEIVENTSWSCIHGVERWRADCGCNSGGHPGWRQAWRTPLRSALDWLRDELATVFESRAKGLLRDPWYARDEYIDIVLDRSPANVDAFLARHAVAPVDGGARVRILELLEMQHHAMLMFASCAWFFDDVAGIETVQVLMRAGRAIQLAEGILGRALEPEFQARLAEARSNQPERGNGSTIYGDAIAKTRVSLRGVAGHLAVESLFRPPEPNGDVLIGAYTMQRLRSETFESGRARMVSGDAVVTSRTTEGSGRFCYVAVHLGDQNISGGVAETSSDSEYELKVAGIRDAFQSGDLTSALLGIRDQFPGPSFSLRSLFKDEQRSIIRRLLDPVLDEAEAVYHRVYEDYRSLIRFLTAADYPLPNRLRAATDFALNLALRHAIAAENIDEAAVRSILEEATLAGVEIDRPAAGLELQAILERLAAALRAHPEDAAVASRFLITIGLLPTIGAEVDLWRTQEVFYETLQQVFDVSRPAIVSSDQLKVLRALGQALRVRLPA